ncbi:MAG: bifunctional phosphopantothenoylcysteine decarboxylase/phosphopantothenate--cysteine ligase CoaBC [Tidjanibacter sp.]|nr:bifunctional phosphopantothenoylcysteine decarboxylase/phosphopantothenate--cysteine ligase CoaBC [Tidjanibacter sp.]
MESKHIILGVTGSIAAYKAAVLTRELVRRGHEVKVVMTPLAKEFITPLTLATLSKNPIAVDFFNPEDGRWNSHVALAEWADLLLIAPATANTLAKMAVGIADNLLLTTVLSARCPIMVAPAMDLDMYAASVTCQNLETLRNRGVQVIEPAEGELASGLSGKGRMAEPVEIAESVEQFFQKKKSLKGRRFIVTAGPTVESIDPVRFISNPSTGRMGYAVAAELASRGAETILVSGPVALAAPVGVRRVDVRSADEMYKAAMELWPTVDGAVMCAAVADYTPVAPAKTKIKKSEADMTLQLRRTHDIAAELGTNKGGRILVGFALETDHEMENAREKLLRKNLDFVVLNSLSDKGACFGGATNKITIVDHDGETVYPLESKRTAAVRIVDRIELLAERSGLCCAD